MNSKPEPARCFICGTTAVNLESGWIRSQYLPNGPIYFLCEFDRARQPYLEWDERGAPYLVGFTGDDDLAAKRVAVLDCLAGAAPR